MNFQMNILKLFMTLSAVVIAESNAFAQINFDTKNIENGEYAYMYSVGLCRKHETGKLDNEGNPVVTGQYRYVLGDKEYVVIYTADKDGFHPKVAILEYEKPLPPTGGVGGYALPAAIVASMVGG